MDFRDLKRIIELMKTNELTELEVEDQGFKVTAKRGGNGEPAIVAAPAAPMIVSQPAAPVAPAPDTGVAAPAPAAPAPASGDDGLESIISPMVGTFYRSPSPDASVFVNVGDEVSDESVVCIIEAMKVMNEIKAEVKGKVTKVLVEDGTPVQYGQPLFLVSSD